MIRAANGTGVERRPIQLALRDWRDMALAGRRTLVRADLNVPMQAGVITDSTRLDRFADGLRELRSAGARCIVMTHLGRPAEQFEADLSVKPLADCLARRLGVEVQFVGDGLSDAALTASRRLANGEVMMIENLRFHSGEEKNDRAFARGLSRLAEVYINDAFSCCHRTHASIDAVARCLPAAAGPLLGAELQALAVAVDGSRSPAAAIIGGAKVSTKIAVLTSLVRKVEFLILGGGLANTFLLAQGHQIGQSLVDRGGLDAARAVLRSAADAGCEVVLPIDAVVAGDGTQNARARTVAVSAVPAEGKIFDIGPETIESVSAVLDRCRSLLWNGPLGLFEEPPFDRGTTAVARVAADRTQAGVLTSVAGGGDTIAALKAADVIRRFSHVSLAGGAFLDWLECQTLPGLDPLAP